MLHVASSFFLLLSLNLKVLLTWKLISFCSNILLRRRVLCHEQHKLKRQKWLVSVLSAWSMTWLMAKVVGMVYDIVNCMQHFDLCKYNWVIHIEFKQVWNAICITACFMRVQSSDHQSSDWVILHMVHRFTDGLSA